MEGPRILSTLVEPVRRRTNPLVRCLGEVRLPLAGPYRPRARLYRLPSGDLVWVVRLWERDRAVGRVVRTETLRTYADASRLPALRRAIDAVVARADAEDHATA